MLRTLTIFVNVTLLSAMLVFATYPGSVISSFFAEPIEEGGVPYSPLGMTYGEGYVWVVYAHALVTKRSPITGSIVASFYLDSCGWQLGWDGNRKYLYDINWWCWINWSDPKTGSTIGSFPNPSTGLLYGVDYDEGHPGRPLWLGQRGPAWAWNLTATGSVVASYDLRSWWHVPDALAYGKTPGGEFVFFGLYSAPPYIFVVNPSTFSVVSSFVAPVGNCGISDLSWDGRYLWVLENGPPPIKPGWVYRFVAYSSPTVEPASVGKIKALYR